MTASRDEEQCERTHSSVVLDAADADEVLDGTDDRCVGGVTVGLIQVGDLWPRSAAICVRHHVLSRSGDDIRRGEASTILMTGDGRETRLQGTSELPIILDENFQG